MKRFLTAWLINLLIISGVFAATITPNLSLVKPDRGDSDWHTSLNSNFDKLDTGYGNNVASIADLPEVYIETGTFDYLSPYIICRNTGDVYQYKVTNMKRSGQLDIKLECLQYDSTAYYHANYETGTVII